MTRKNKLIYSIFTVLLLVIGTSGIQLVDVKETKDKEVSSVVSAHVEKDVVDVELVSADFKSQIYEPEFIPTREWQDIKPGQGIPRVST